MVWSNSWPHPVSEILAVPTEHTDESAGTSALPLILSLSLISSERNIAGHANGKYRLIEGRKNNTAVNMWAEETSLFF